MTETRTEAAVTRTIDDIVLMVPGCHGEEYDVRARIRGYRNAMTALIASTESDTARALAWLVVEYSSGHLYAATTVERLKEIRGFCHRLSLVALQAEDIDQ